MITNISIQNYALINSLNIDLAPGLNVITGETGAGKSIIIDALSLLLGGRAVKGNIRAGERKMTVSALFDLSDSPEVKRLLENEGIELEGEDLVLSREVDRKSRNVCRINGTIVPLATLKRIGNGLIDIHSQHENVSLFQTDSQRRLLDKYAEKNVPEILEEIGRLTEELKKLAKNIRELQKSGKEAARQYSIDQFQLKEIDKFALVDGEEEELEEKEKSLEKGELIYEKSQQASVLLSGEDSEIPDVTGLLSDLAEQMDSLAEDDPWFKSYAEQVRDASVQMNSISYDLNSYMDRLDYNPGELAQVHNRLGEIDELKKKYGDSIREILDYAQNLRERVNRYENADDLLSGSKEQYSQLRKEYNQKAQILTQLRNEAADRLKNELEGELADLAMEKARVVIDMKTDRDLISANGQDQVRFLISVNPGVEPRELRKVASGGEISRIMLALKGIFGDKDEIGTMIFDEIDTGISGRTAQVVAEKITRLSTKRQIICISHLPQIAAMADSQFLVTKMSGEDSTEVSFEELSESSRTTELARMLGGAEVTELTKENAREMIRQAAALKKSEETEAV